MARQVIAFHYSLTDNEGKTLDSSRGKDPLMFLEGSGQIIPGLEEELVAMKAGDKKDVTVPYKKAYGPYDQKQIFTVPKEKFPAHIQIKIGDVLQIGEKDDFKVVQVIDIAEANVTLDANHPLAGKDLYFSVEITERRDATADELAHGHAHGHGGHHH